MFWPTGLSIEIGKLRRSVEVCANAGWALAKQNATRSRRRAFGTDRMMISHLLGGAPAVETVASIFPPYQAQYPRARGRPVTSGGQYMHKNRRPKPHAMKGHRWRMI